MAYSITLSEATRKGMDWIGYRYNIGDTVASVLCDTMGPDDEWSQPGPITFNLPEHKAWEIADLINEDTEDGRTSIPCLSPSAAEPFYTLLESIV